MADPDAAVAGLADGFAEYIGVDKEYVSVLSTDPDLYGGSRRLGARNGRGLSTSLTAEYAVDLPPEVLAETPDLLTTVEAALNDATPEALQTLSENLVTSLQEQGIEAEVEVTGVVAEVVTITAEPTPAPTAAPAAAAKKADTDDDDDDTAVDPPERSSGLLLLGGGLVLVIGIVVVVGVGFTQTSAGKKFHDEAPKEAPLAAQEAPATTSPTGATPKEKVETPATAAELGEVTLEIHEPEPADEAGPTPKSGGLTGLDETATSENTLVVAAGPSVDAEPDVRPWWYFGCAPACDFKKPEDPPPAAA